jgi:hypothetical protein
VGQIFIPPTVREDETGTLWEFVKGTPAYDHAERQGYAEVLGCELKVGDILQTRSFAGLDIGWGFYLITAEDVVAVHAWMTEADDD